MEFKQYYPDLINSEGPILSLLDLEEDYLSGEDTYDRLFIKGTCLSGKANIYVAVNEFTLELFFQSRITVKELFLLGKDQQYIMEYNGSFNKVFYDEDFERKVLQTIESANAIYAIIPEESRLKDPFKDVLKYVRQNYINGYGSFPPGQYGKEWLKKFK
jgi:hypothetical protein